MKSLDPILSAARGEIIAHGANALNLAAVARAAGVSRPTVYKRFPNIQHLIADVLAAELHTILQQVAVMPDTRDHLVELIGAFTEQARTSELIISLRKMDPEVLATYIFERQSDTQRALVDYLATLIRRVQDHDPERMNHENPDQLARMIVRLGQSAAFCSPEVVEEFGGAEQWRDEFSKLYRRYLAQDQD